MKKIIVYVNPKLDLVFYYVDAELIIHTNIKQLKENLSFHGKVLIYSPISLSLDNDPCKRYEMAIKNN